MENTFTSGLENNRVDRNHLDAWVEHEIFANKGNSLPNDYPDDFFDRIGMSRECFFEIVKRAKRRLEKNGLVTK